MKDIMTLYGVKHKAKSLDIYLYDDIEGDNVNWWTGEAKKSQTSAKAIAEALSAAGEIENISVYINSYGGDVKEGLGIYNQLKRHPAHVTAYIDGFACSIASVIAMAADDVVMGSNALMMIHRAWSYAVGNAKELRKAADDLDVIDAASNSSYLDKAGDKLSPDDLAQMLDNETWLSAQECLKIGLADRIGSAPRQEEEAAERLEQTRQALTDRAVMQLRQRRVSMAEALTKIHNTEEENK